MTPTVTLMLSVVVGLVVWMGVAAVLKINTLRDLNQAEVEYEQAYQELRRAQLDDRSSNHDAELEACLDAARKFQRVLNKLERM